jgi:hypothetical protein
MIEDLSLGENSSEIETKSIRAVSYHGEQFKMPSGFREVVHAQL